MTEISDIKASERTIEIKHPVSKAPIGVQVILMSIDDDRMKKTKRALRDRRLAAEARNKHLKSEEMEDNGNALLFASMIGWLWYDPTTDGGKDVTKFHGEVPPFNRNNVYAVFTELPWFRDQVDEELADNEAFFAVSK